jgi:prepilin-type N-terminal cleavage/methylation domain-containing protein
VKRRSFTLLEVVVAIALIAIAAGSLGLKLHRLIEKKRFESDVGQFLFQAAACQRLAVNMQSDWRGVFSKQGGDWVFKASCVDQPKERSLPQAALRSVELSFNGEARDVLFIDFYASGEVLPHGSLTLSKDTNKPKALKKTVVFPDLFSREESRASKHLGPLHPLEGN